MHLAGEDLLMALYKLFYPFKYIYIYIYIYISLIHVISEKTQYSKDFTVKFGRDFYMKIITTVNPTKLVTNSLSSIF